MNLQRGNALCVMGTVAHHRKLEEIKELFRHKKSSLTLKDAGVVQKCPVGFRLAAISLRSRKFLTLSIYILTRW